MATATRRAWYTDPITDRQHAAIRLIQDLMGHKFEGNCKGQAMAFIGEHYDEAKRIRSLRKGSPKRTFLKNAEVSKTLLEVKGPWDN